MDITTLIKGERVYFDTNIWIYAFEGFSEYKVHISRLFSNIDEGLFRAVTSELTLAEILVKPLLEKNIELQIKTI
jgi:predicted nucleic acid-binding protein